MKSLLLLFLPVTLLASQDNPTKAELLQTIRHIETLATQTQQELQQEKDANAKVKIQLKAAQDDLVTTQNQFATYQKAAETEIAKGNAAIASLAHVVSALHRAKWIMCGLWVALCAFIALKLQSIPVLGAYSLYAVGTLGVAGIAAIWFWL